MIAVRFSGPARRDLKDATVHYSAVAGQSVAARFVDAWTECRVLLSTYPEAGSPRFGVALGAPDIRSLPLRGFPYLVFYRIGPQGIMVLRILHSARDIPATLRP
ncbi:MAG: hypothetical protein RIR62_1700 [Pseudomonadota bacterium]